MPEPGVDLIAMLPDEAFDKVLECCSGFPCVATCYLREVNKRFARAIRVRMHATEPAGTGTDLGTDLGTVEVLGRVQTFHPRISVVHQLLGLERKPRLQRPLAVSPDLRWALLLGVRVHPILFFDMVTACRTSDLHVFAELWEHCTRRSQSKTLEKSRGSREPLFDSTLLGQRLVEHAVSCGRGTVARLLTELGVQYRPRPDPEFYPLEWALMLMEPK